MSLVAHPAGLEWCDLDSDSRLDLVISDLGSFQPEDSKLGQVVWLRQRATGGFDESVIADGMGRVSEARAADFNGDGLLDLVVAEFGWLETGNILLFLQRMDVNGNRTFDKSIVDERHGTIRVPPVDLNQDGSVDFVANISQEHEAVEVFLNSGDARFQNQRLCSPKDPAFGSSGMQAVDLDQDGDIDFLVANGDMFDSFSIKPFHGLRWLENQGMLRFKEHEILAFPGVHGIATGDLDGDGDLDIVVTALFPYRLFTDQEESKRDVVSAVWLEQIPLGRFLPHLIEQGTPWHACVILADIDFDHDLDIIMGDFSPTPAEPRSPLVIYENEAKASQP
ncbi:MAG: VCBS repeat-containing protein [Planctomycetaceae bacterium]